jgi:hypothetical protein
LNGSFFGGAAADKTLGVNLITGCGFQSPNDKQNFLRWFTVQTNDELCGLAAFALGILHRVFEQDPEIDLRINTHFAEDD